MTSLYPLKFYPVFRDKVWGGQRIKTILGKNFDPLPNCGETWEISGMEGFDSVVRNGFLAGNTLPELAEVYMGDLVGDKVFDTHGTYFPLLIKFVDADDPLSVQVHPNSAVAKERHGAYGKTEMWYVVHAEPGAEIIVGFKPGIDKAAYLNHLKNNTLSTILNIEKAFAGDVFFMPAGRIHAIGAGVTLCEIQQASDITYRVYDWDRPGQDGKPRDLHLEEAIGVIDFAPVSGYKTLYTPRNNAATKLVSCPYFTTNLLLFDRQIEYDYYHVDSFVIYICIEGSFRMLYAGGEESVVKGDVVLLPAELKNIQLIPDGHVACRLIESYIA